jgi:hydroxymethylglutaryl-CoA reductase
MALHARQVATAAGAPPEMVSAIAEQMVSEGRVHIDRAMEIIKNWRVA